VASLMLGMDASRDHEGLTSTIPNWSGSTGDPIDEPQIVFSLRDVRLALQYNLIIVIMSRRT
jgi:hypothetical protein